MTVEDLARPNPDRHGRLDANENERSAFWPVQNRRGLRLLRQSKAKRVQVMSAIILKPLAFRLVERVETIGRSAVVIETLWSR